MARREDLQRFLQGANRCALVEVGGAKGSTPREEGAWMLVSPSRIFGTIGGGQLEFMAIDRARELIVAGEPSTDRLDIPLGPEIGQCCGGRVQIDIVVLDKAALEGLANRVAGEDAGHPHVLLFGGGHVGHALASALALLPLQVRVVETRAEALEDMPPGVQQTLTAMPEREVRAAPPRSAFVVLTHDHALDFLVAAEALARQDAVYVGMIGSQTKRATFSRWFMREQAGPAEGLDRLTCPIGGTRLRDKRPAVIAAMAAAEILQALLGSGEAATS